MAGPNSEKSQRVVVADQTVTVNVTQSARSNPLVRGPLQLAACNMAGSNQRDSTSSRLHRLVPTLAHLQPITASVDPHTCPPPMPEFMSMSMELHDRQTTLDTGRYYMLQDQISVSGDCTHTHTHLLTSSSLSSPP